MTWNAGVISKYIQNYFSILIASTEMGTFLWLKKYTCWNFEETIFQLELEELLLGPGGAVEMAQSDSKC